MLIYININALKNGLKNKKASLSILYYKLELDYKDRCKINVSIHT